MHNLAPGYEREPVLVDLMRTYGNDVWNFAFFLTKRIETADDLSQEVFLTAFDRLYLFRGECSVKTWLLTLTRNKALNHLRSSFIRKVTLADHLKHDALHSPSAENVVLSKLEIGRVWNKVLELPLKFREVTIMAYHYEMSTEEMAAALGVSPGTVKSRLYRAKKRMAILLKESDFNG